MEENTQPQQTQETPQAQPEVTVTQTPTNTQVSIKTAEEAAAIQAADPSTQPPQEQPKQVEVQQMMQQQTQAETDIKNDLSTKGVDFNALASEYDTKGELSADSLAKLEKAGYPKSVVDAYLNGLSANTEKFVNAVQGMAGGQEEYQKLAGFIKAQGDGVRNAFNAALQSGDLGQIQLAISGLKAQMVNTYGTQGRTIMAGGAPAGVTEGYTTTAQMVSDMSDPRYQTDAKFTREVVRKIELSKLF